MTSPGTWARELFGVAPTCPECHAAVTKAEAHCTSCGYDPARQTRPPAEAPEPGLTREAATFDERR